MLLKSINIYRSINLTVRLLHSGIRMSKTMKGITVREFGGPEVCEYSTDLPMPEPNDNQVGF